MKFSREAQDTTPLCMLWFQVDQTAKTKAPHRDFFNVRFSENANIPAIIRYVLPKRLTIDESAGGVTHQADKDAKELDDVCVGDGIEAAEDCVEDGDGGTHEDGHSVADVQDDRQSGAYWWTRRGGRGRRSKSRISYHHARQHNNAYLTISEDSASF